MAASRGPNEDSSYFCDGTEGKVHRELLDVVGMLFRIERDLACRAFNVVPSRFRLLKVALRPITQPEDISILGRVEPNDEVVIPQFPA